MNEPAVPRLKKFRRRTTLAAFGILVAVWAVLYLPHLRTNPGWYGDETLAVTAAQHLIPGPPAHRAIWNTFWHPYAPYQPGYLAAVAAMLGLTGDIVGPRFFNALLGLATAGVMFGLGRRVLGSIPAFFAALVFLGYEQSIIHFRWIFTHNLIALGFTITFLELARRSTLRTNLAAGCGLALGAAALPLFSYGAVAAGLWRLPRPAAWLPLALPSVLVVAVSLAWGWAAHGGAFLGSDLAAMAGFYSEASRENSGSLTGLASNLLVFFTHDPLHVLGGAAILLCWNRRARAIGFGAAVVAVLLLQNRQNLPVFYYQAIVLLPLMVLAIGNLLARAMHGLRRVSRRLSLAAAAAAFLIPLALIAGNLPRSLQGTFVPRNQFWVTQSVPEVEAAAAWINEQVDSADLVICHHNIAWLLKCRTADYLMLTTWAGVTTWPFHTPLPREQFRFPVDASQARFLVVGDIDDRWTFSQPNVADVLEKQTGDNWELAWESNTYRIFRKKSPSSSH